MTHTNNNKLDCPQYLEYWTCDGLAENLPCSIENNGIADRTYAHIWNVIIPQMELDQKASLKEIGYDSLHHYCENLGGDDGTLREMCEMQKYWHLLEDDMKAFLIDFADARLKNDMITEVITNDLDTKELLKLKELIEDRIADRKDGGYN